MAERFTCFAGGVASGTNKTIINIFDPAVTPIQRGAIYDIVIGSDDAPGDQAFRCVTGRTTAVGTEGAGYVPNNIDPGGPAGAYDSGNAHSAEPTYTANKELLVFSVNQRASFRWVAAPESALRMAATQNNGLGIKSGASTSTQAHECTVLFFE